MAVAYAHCKFCSDLFAYDARWPRAYCTAHNDERDRRSRTRFVSAQCAICGEWFIGDRQQHFNRGNGASARCSDRCTRRAGKDTRRARKRDAYVADVNRRRVFESDGWRCHICGKRVKRTATAPDPMAPTIDHVIPLARGGTHEPSNCRTAHFGCNSSKSDAGGGEQMLLLAV